MLDGAWIPVQAELGGQTILKEALKNTKLIIKGDHYTAEVNGVIDQGKIELQPGANPKSMRIIGVEGPNKGRAYPAIYELNGDTLKICYNLGGESLPKEFKTETGAQLYLVTYNLRFAHFEN